ncbi:hypothetical protein B0I35DRAFT_90670 [Stachybotrys elegans]|uniref:Uncharacterized protein n=1 Tax=Stachybotrys elegans TaxID=80388 RepID=A0A8K0WM49_9HYPO|nr:hypothetical protein B0I35DRAFT_90670 [Stachybotrys elegans]
MSIHPPPMLMPMHPLYLVALPCPLIHFFPFSPLNRPRLTDEPRLHRRGRRPHPPRPGLRLQPGRQAYGQGRSHLAPLDLYSVVSPDFLSPFPPKAPCLSCMMLRVAGDCGLVDGVGRGEGNQNEMDMALRVCTAIASMDFCWSLHRALHSGTRRRLFSRIRIARLKMDFAFLSLLSFPFLFPTLVQL